MKANVSGTMSGPRYMGITSLALTAEDERDARVLRDLFEVYAELSRRAAAEAARPADGGDWLGAGEFGGGGWLTVDEFMTAGGSDFSQIMMVFDGPLTADEIRRASGCLGYALREVLAGEDLSEPGVRETSPRARLSYYYDSNKSRRDDPDYREAFERAARYVCEGTPVRATNRAGAGTKGTRLVEGIGPRAVSFFVR